MAPHHILGIKDLAAFFAGSEEDNARLRQDLEQFGEQAGNAPGNYTGLYDGDLSPAGRKIGMRSSDHRDVHKGPGGADNIIKQLGITTNRADRTKDTYNGVLISELPYDIKRALLLQYAYLNQRRVTQIQQDRSATIQSLHPQDTYQQRSDRIKFNPTSFANEPRKKNSFADLMRQKVQQLRTGQVEPKPKAFPNRLIRQTSPEPPALQNLRQQRRILQFGGQSDQLPEIQDEFNPSPGIGSPLEGGRTIDMGDFSFGTV